MQFASSLVPDMTLDAKVDKALEFSAEPCLKNFAIQVLYL